MRIPFHVTVILIIVMLLVPVIAITGAAENNLLNAKAPEFTLQDQYDRTVALRGLEGHIVVLLASDKEGSAQNPAWQKAILDRYKKGIMVLGLADLRSAPFFSRERSRTTSKSRRGAYSWTGRARFSRHTGDKESFQCHPDR